jgi:hypothetical protein
MASVIEDKLFELVTKSENFDFSYDIYERFDSIKERMVLDFWNLLILKLKKEFQDLKLLDRSGSNFHLDISHKSLKITTFYIGIYELQFQFGISITHNGTKKKVQELEDRFRDLFLEYEYNEKEKISWFFESEEEDFSTLFGLKKILPENREILLDNYFSDFKVMIDTKLEEILDFEKSLK